MLLFLYVPCQVLVWVHIVILLSLLQGQSTQTVFSKSALRDRNMQVRFFGRWFWNPEIWEILLVQPVFIKSILCAIYGPICKLAKKFGGTNILNVTTVKLLLKNKIQCFWGFLMSFCFKLYLKVNIHPFHDFLLIIAWKWPLKLAIFQNSLRN